MGTKTYSQFGTSLIVVFTLVITVFLWLMIQGGASSPEFMILSLLLLFFVIAMLIFYNITITISDTDVSFKLGIGLIRKTYTLSDIKTCRVVKNSLLTGIGIRMLPNGWLYNVSGQYAVELAFKSRKSVVRIGTDKPEEVAAEIQSRLNKEIIPSEIMAQARYFNPWWLVVILVVLLIPVLSVLIGAKEPTITVYQNEIKIGGFYGSTIPFNKIITLDTISELPDIRLRTNGYAFGKTLKGHFKLADKTYVTLFIKKDNPPYIYIQSHNIEACMSILRISSEL